MRNNDKATRWKKMEGGLKKDKRGHRGNGSKQDKRNKDRNRKGRVKEEKI
jgi:hypothetical protein